MPIHHAILERSLHLRFRLDATAKYCLLNRPATKGWLSVLLISEVQFAFIEAFTDNPVCNARDLRQCYSGYHRDPQIQP